MILFLDDDPKRLFMFQSHFPAAELAATAQETIDLIVELGTLDCLFLDHDLDGQIYVDSSEKNTGMEVVRWIIVHKPVINKIIVHSLNHEAAIDMVDELTFAGYRAEYIPFIDLNFEKIRAEYENV